MLSTFNMHGLRDPGASGTPDEHAANQATSPVPEPGKRVSSGEAAEAMILMPVVMSLLWETEPFPDCPGTVAGKWKAQSSAGIGVGGL